MNSVPPLFQLGDHDIPFVDFALLLWWEYLPTLLLLVTVTTPRVGGLAQFGKYGRSVRRAGNLAWPGAGQLGQRLFHFFTLVIYYCTTPRRATPRVCVCVCFHIDLLA